jgi:hypothetical protein
MVPYHLNMARGFVMPLEVRKKWLSWFMGYLLVSSVLIALVLYRVIDSSSNWHAKRDALTRQEARVLAGCPDYKTLAEYKGVVQGKVVSSLREADALVDFERNKSRAASVFLGLAEPLPPGAELGTVDCNPEARKLRFEVVMPVTLKMDDKLSPTTMVAVWEREPLLAGRLSQIEVENSERVKRDGVEMMCWRFSAIVGEK